MAWLLRRRVVGPVLRAGLEVALRCVQRALPRVHGIVLVVCNGDAELRARVTAAFGLIRKLEPERYDRMARELSCVIVQESPMGHVGRYLPLARTAVLAPSLIRKVGAGQLVYLLLRLAVKARLANAGFRPDGRDTERAKRIWRAEAEYLRARYAARKAGSAETVSPRPAG